MQTTKKSQLTKSQTTKSQATTKAQLTKESQVSKKIIRCLISAGAHVVKKVQLAKTQANTK